MGRSTSIADVGMSIVKLLRRELVPDTLQNPDAVGLCSPTDRGDYMVGIHLYDIRESEELRVNTMIARGTEELQYPPSYVNLYYMITVTSTGDIKFRSGEEHKMRIYSVPNAGYKLSLFYRAAPVEIESTRSRRAARVMDVDFGLEEKQ